MHEPRGFRRVAAGAHPPNRFEGYRSTLKRAPRRAPIPLAPTLSEITGPVFGDEAIGPFDDDLTRQHEGEAIGERIIVTGCVMDEDGTPVPGTLVEVWQPNAAGRYWHQKDQHPAPLDPNFTGVGRMLTDAGGTYRLTTVRPGAYPWGNETNAWRPPHIHFSVFGPAISTRLITQMYFPGDPLLEFDPIFQSVPDASARRRLVARFDREVTVEQWALGYRFDIVLRGRDATPADVHP